MGVRFVEWDDNDASFTDYAVACHMDELGIDYLVTPDHHSQLFDVVTVPNVHSSEPSDDLNDWHRRLLRYRS
ncbi:hypothetical protein C479_13648 [Halovivax asiaticus JCM 14624]|uniref:Uncharacterized protein n=2 Tax=Halovivax asiaticus TaxID=332953 RepID=M0BD29_9EURY|nr:hypothetical protein C479_13648 [Halovivax asiaticus JCM 14624]